MTGYGRGTAVDAGSGQAFSVEIRSVNHRGLDLKIRSGEPDAYTDVEITRRVRAAIERGAVTVSIREESLSQPTVGLARVRAARLHLEGLRLELGLPAPVDLATVAAFLALEGRSAPSPLRGEALWTTLEPAVRSALAELARTRLSEGLALRADVEARLEQLTAILAALPELLAPLPERFARRLSEKLAGLRDLPGYEPGRVAQELALLADRLDVSEELVRLRAHLDHLRSLLDSGPAIGRKLDFVIQEIGREINTLGSKAQDAAVAAQVIEAKSELEKMREQAQNIE